MDTRKQVVAISGSTRSKATNHQYIDAIGQMAAGMFDVKGFFDIAALPHYNPDQDTDQVNETVAGFRDMISNSDGVIICTPEYAHGIPGTLKNAIDWTVSSASFSKKATMLITASTDGKYAHHALLEVLNVIEANVNNHHIYIQFARTKINAEHVITDAATYNDINVIIGRFYDSMNEDISVPA